MPIEDKPRNSGEEPENPPRRRRIEGDDKETPFIVDEFDPYFNQPPDDEDKIQVQDTDWEDDSFYRDPEEFWLEEGMWPWPEVSPRKEGRPKSPKEIEPGKPQ